MTCMRTIPAAALALSLAFAGPALSQTDIAVIEANCTGLEIDSLLDAGLTAEELAETCLAGEIIRPGRYDCWGEIRMTREGSLFDLSGEYDDHYDGNQHGTVNFFMDANAVWTGTWSDPNVNRSGRFTAVRPSTTGFEADWIVTVPGASDGSELPRRSGTAYCDLLGE